MFSTEFLELCPGTNHALCSGYYRFVQLLQEVSNQQEVTFFCKRLADALNDGVGEEFMRQKMSVFWKNVLSDVFPKTYQLESLPHSCINLLEDILNFPDMALLAKSICEEVLHKHSLEDMVALFPYPSSQEKVDSNYDKFVCCFRMTHSVEDVNSLCESLSDKFLFNPKVLADRKQQLAYNTKQMLVLFWTRTYHLIQKYDPKSAVFNDLLLPDLLTILDESFMPILLVSQINQVLDAVKKVKKVTLLKYIFAPVILDDVIDAPDELDLEESDLCGKEGSHNIKDQAISKANDGKKAYRYFILEFMKFNLKDEIKLFCEKLHNEINGETNETILQTLLIKMWMKIYCYMKPKE